MQLPNLTPFAKKMDSKGAYGSVLALVSAVMVLCGGTPGWVVGALMCIPICILAVGMVLEHIPYALLKIVREKQKLVPHQLKDGI